MEGAVGVDLGGAEQALFMALQGAAGITVTQQTEVSGEAGCMTGLTTFLTSTAFSDLLTHTNIYTSVQVESVRTVLLFSIAQLLTKVHSTYSVGVLSASYAEWCLAIGEESVDLSGVEKALFVLM